jgi:hypothetical protein
MTNPAKQTRKAGFHAMLGEMLEQAPYVSYEQLKSASMSGGIIQSEETLRDYLKQSVRTGVVHRAGRGWYTRLEKPAELNPELVEDIATRLEERFPLLPHYVWSTQQFNPWMHHLLGRAVVFVYVDAEGQEDVVEFLRNLGWAVTVNPSRKTGRDFAVRGKSVVVRGITREIESQKPPIETALVDLFTENERLPLLDEAEFRAMAGNLLSQHRIDVARIQRLLGDRKRTWVGFLGEEITQHLGIS